MPPRPVLMPDAGFHANGPIGMLELRCELARHTWEIVGMDKVGKWLADQATRSIADQRFNGRAGVTEDTSAIDDGNSVGADLNQGAEQRLAVLRRCAVTSGGVALSGGKRMTGHRACSFPARTSSQLNLACYIVTARAEMLQC